MAPTSTMPLDFRRLRTILCLGAHADDLEIGCGGTIARILAASPAVVVHWHVFSATGPRRAEAARSAKAWLADARRPVVRIGRYRESYFPQDWAKIKDDFERIKAQVDPDLVLTHWRDDRHQDHRVLSDLAWNTYRNHTILEYEIPKYDGDLGQPNVYVGIDDAAARLKVSRILAHFPTQAGRHWFTEDTFLGLMRVRGLESGPRSRYAEAFHARKLVL
ncbi:MAG: PIG-L deacetylase family protein [Vicinamibacterales bacterium]